ncbi:MAG: flagellin lysine-N-methylase [Eubacteriales bacterium]
MRKTSRIPSYLNDFHCIASECRDNCCIGWDVDIDKATYAKYETLEDEELLARTKKYIYKNKDAFNDNIDYACVKLLSQKRCAFLNNKNLCMLQAKMGEEYLSNVCATYPRLINEIDGVTEYSATVSCEEAARLILLNQAGFQLKTMPSSQNDRSILTYKVNTRKKGQIMMVTYLNELREFTMAVLKKREYSLEERMLILKGFYLELDTMNYGKNVSKIKPLIERYIEELNKPGKCIKTQNNSTIIKSAYGGSKDLKIDISAENPNIKITLILEFLGELEVFKEIDSKSFVELAREFLKGLDLVENDLVFARKKVGIQSGNNSLKRESGSREDSHKKAFLKYAVAQNNYYEPFMKKHEYILENYLVNYVYGNLFPASESERPRDAFMMLAIRFFIIKTMLIGISGNSKGMSPEMLVSFIQSFSKAIEHHKTFLEDLLAMAKKIKAVNQDMGILIL